MTPGGRRCCFVICRTCLLKNEARGTGQSSQSLGLPCDEPQLFEGVQEGTIAFETKGDRGFGYDPVFLIDGVRAQAEISDEEKDAISHRGQAVRAAVAWLQEQGL